MITRKPLHVRQLILAGAVATIALSSVALGQARVNTGGALDRNNRIGSGGVNPGGGPQMRSWELNNNIVTGNVTGGRQFRGNTASGDPRAFRGSISAGGVDRFVAQSAGPTVVQGNYYGDSRSNAQAVRPFFGTSEGVAPPPGFVQLGSTGGFVPAPAPPSRSGADLRLGQVFETPTIALQRPGSLILPGAVDASNNNLLISASPLYGVRGLNTGVASDVRFLNRYATSNFESRPLSNDEATIRRMQIELFEGSDESAEPSHALDNTTPNAALDDSTENTLNNQAIKSDFATGQQAGARVALPSAVKQSAQYRELEARLDKFKADQDSAAQANKLYNEQVRLKSALEQGESSPIQPPTSPRGSEPGAPGAQPGMPGANPAVPAGDPGAVMPVPPRRAERVPRQTVTSLATGVQAKGLAEVLTDAEKLMREQKFVSALDKYDIAEQVAPNNPMVLLGRANAELGASYYARAETHLREAFMGAPALMMARYDLRQFLGDDRLAFLVKDLKEIANNEKNASRPLILLAYIAFNEGNDRMATGYLDLAEKRLGRPDPFFNAVRQHWELPAFNANATDPGK